MDPIGSCSSIIVRANAGPLLASGMAILEPHICAANLL